MDAVVCSYSNNGPPQSLFAAAIDCKFNAKTNHSETTSRYSVESSQPFDSISAKTIRTVEDWQTQLIDEGNRPV